MPLRRVRCLADISRKTSGEQRRSRDCFCCSTRSRFDRCVPSTDARLPGASRFAAARRPILRAGSCIARHGPGRKSGPRGTLRVWSSRYLDRPIRGLRIGYTEERDERQCLRSRICGMCNGRLPRARWTSCGRRRRERREGGDDQRRHVADYRAGARRSRVASRAAGTAVGYRLGGRGHRRGRRRARSRSARRTSVMANPTTTGWRASHRPSARRASRARGRSRSCCAAPCCQVRPSGCSRVLSECSGAGRMAEPLRIAVNPEFMREGVSIEDFDHPPFDSRRLRRSGYGDSAASAVRGRASAPFMQTSVRTAEMVKARRSRPPWPPRPR